MAEAFSTHKILNKEMMTLSEQLKILQIAKLLLAVVVIVAGVDGAGVFANNLLLPREYIIIDYAAEHLIE